jgi:hypothetical protein
MLNIGILAHLQVPLDNMDLVVGGRGDQDNTGSIFEAPHALLDVLGVKIYNITVVNLGAFDGARNYLLEALLKLL